MIQNKRQKQLGSILQQEISTYLQRNNPISTNGVNFININAVKISKKTDFADFYISLFNDDEAVEKDVLQQLQEQAPLMRKFLSSVLNWRKTPAIRFHIDESIKRSRYMDNKLNNLK